MSTSNENNQNIKVLRNAINYLRSSGQENSQIKSVYFSPGTNGKHISSDIDFIWNDKKNYSNSINVSFQEDKVGQKLRGTVDIDVDMNQPFYNIYNLDLNSHVNKIRKFKDELNNMFQNNKLDETQTKGLKKIQEKLDNNIEILQLNNNIRFNENENKDLLIFSLSHELSHLSFNKKLKFDFGLMDGVKITESDKKLMNSVFQTINKSAHSKQQYNGATYISMRDEIHSDTAGAFFLAYSKMKENRFNPDEFYNLMDKIGKLRYTQAIGNDINAIGSHKTDMVFSKENLDKIVNLAKNFNQSPNMDLKKSILSLSETAFFNTIKKDGIIIQAGINVDNLVKENIRDVALTSDIYQFQAKNENYALGEYYDSCNSYFSSKKSSYQEQCAIYLNGSQLSVVDKNSDSVMDYKTTSSAFEAVNKKEKPNQTENRMLKEEGDALERFVNINNIKSSATDALSNASIDMKKKNLTY